MNNGILAGLRIIDCAAGLSGSAAALLLAETGAEVIKIEPPGGTALREEQSLFAVVNRSKQSRVIELSTQEGQEELHDFLCRADILIHDFDTGMLEELGLTDELVRQRHPHLISAGVSGYPRGHPKDHLPLVDSLVLAESGILDEQVAVKRAGPTFLRFPLGSWGAAWLAAIGVVVRLLNRDRGAAAGPVHTSLLQGALIPLAMFWYQAERPSKSLAIGLPKDSDFSVFECGDGKWLHLMTNADHVPLMKGCLEKMPEVMLVEQPPDSAFQALFPLMKANRQAFLSHPRRVWLEALWEADISVQPVLNPGDLYSDEQALINGYVVEVEDTVLGVTRQPAVPLTVDPPPVVKNPAPVLDSFSGESRPRKCMGENTRTQRLPLEGLKVLDMGNFLAGPLAPMLMADLGAEVIKLESVAGDQMRWLDWGFNACQRGKRSIALELKKPESRRVLEKLVKWADVVHHNLRLPAARKLGISYEDLKSINPRLIYCHVSSYGPTGPRRDWPGYDQLFQASAGWEHISAGQGNPPIWTRFGMMDHQAANASLFAVLLALYQRDKTGEGQAVDASLLGASIFTTAETVQLPDGTCTPVRELDTRQMGYAYWHRLYECADGWLLLYAERAAAWKQLLVRAGVADGSALESMLAAMTLSRALRLVNQAGVWGVQARQNHRDAFFADVDNQAAGLIAEYEHPVFGGLKQIGASWDFVDMQSRIERAPPLLGQHSREIMREHDFSDDEIDALMAARVSTEP